MNQLIKFTVFIWLCICAISVWIGMALVGFFFSFTGWHVLYNITPFIGLTAAICIIKCAIYVLLRSNPMEYLEAKTNKLRSFFGKENI